MWHLRLAPAQFLFLVVVAISGCAAHTGGKHDLLTFLTAGTTTRAEAILRLGEPSRSYEDSRILTYWLEEEDSGYVVLRPVAPMAVWERVAYSLVLVFDGQGVLQKHSLVAIRSP